MRAHSFTCSADLLHGQIFEKERELAQLNLFDLAVLISNTVQKPMIGAARFTTRRTLFISEYKNYQAAR